MPPIPQDSTCDLTQRPWPKSRINIHSHILAIFSCSSLFLLTYLSLDKTMYDDQGTSLVLIQNEKGSELFQRISPYITHKSMPLQESIIPNPSAYSSPSMPCNRKYLFDMLPDESFPALVDTALSGSIPYDLYKR